MKKENYKRFLLPVSFLAAFVLWTVLVRLVDVAPVGPLGSSVGFSHLNLAFHNLTGVHWALYDWTDRLSLIPLLTVAGFGLLGLSQWIRRKKLLKVDRSILALGGFYLLTGAAFLLFEVFPVNYRPLLIGGELEASYPSSTTLLVLCVMPTAMMQLRGRIKQPMLRKCVSIAITAFIVFMVIGRLVSGVHWLTDIIGGSLLSAGLVMMYDSLIGGKIHE